MRTAALAALTCVLALAALGGCKDECASLTPRAELRFDFAGVGRKAVKTLRISVAIDGATARTRDVAVDSLSFDGEVGRMVLTFDGPADVRSDGGKLRVSFIALDDRLNIVARGVNEQTISADGCNFILIGLGPGAGHVRDGGAEGGGGDGGGGGGRDDGGVTVPIADIDKAPNTARLNAKSVAVGSILVCNINSASGLADLVVTYPTHDGKGGTSVGRVQVFHDASATALTQEPNFDLYGANSGDNLGAAVACGDLDGDGKQEIIVGVPGHDGGTGRVYVFKGQQYDKAKLDLASSAASPKEVLTRIDGSAAAGELGASVAVARTVDNSQTANKSLVIGAPGADMAYVVFGRKTWASPLALNNPPDIDALVINADGGWGAARFGSSVTAGSLTGDLRDDEVVIAGKNATYTKPSNILGAGVVAVYHLDGAKKALSQERLLLWGASDNAHFGSAVLVGDLDRDGTADLLVGAPNVEMSDSSRVGHVYLFPGDTSLLAVKGELDTAKGGFKVAFRGPADAGFGAALAARGSSEIDLLIGAPAYQSNRGAVFHVAGRKGYSQGAIIDARHKDTVQLYRGIAGGQLGTFVAGGIFGSADSRADLFVTAPGERSAYIVLLP